MNSKEKLQSGTSTLNGEVGKETNVTENWTSDDSSSPTPTDTKSQTVITFQPGDPENPYNWPTKKKMVVVLVVLNTIFNASISSALPSGGIAFIANYFHITSEEQLVLPVSVYLVGYCFGPLAWGPLSETFGRKAVMVPAFGMFLLFSMACALAPNWPALIVFRFFVGLGAACAISVVGGVYADIFDDPVSRGRAMAAFMAVRLHFTMVINLWQPLTAYREILLDPSSDPSSAVSCRPSAGDGASGSRSSTQEYHSRHLSFCPRLMARFF